ncbi:FadR/GntR family transcriptional regulator [Haloimpatiens sp. FM7330]|uniref:FadR/GntR family transcriptional regulator n=1 Tax=Haloimpatiens sp. FM7330 TaxID=3298610 RepID=UPI00364154C8
MFKPVKSEKVYEQVIEQIKNMIADGTLKKGDKLLSERELSQQFNVSRSSVREALRALQIIGLIECRHGEGNFIRESFEDSLFQPLSIMFMLQESRPSEILELRKIIESETAALAAKRINEEELRELHKLVELLKNADDENEKVILDKKFHYKIAHASKNFLILNILNSISYIMDIFIKDARLKIMKKDENKNMIYQQHNSIYEALASHNLEKTSEMMKRHLEFIDENIK